MLVVAIPAALPGPETFISILSFLDILHESDLSELRHDSLIKLIHPVFDTLDRLRRDLAESMSMPDPLRCEADGPGFIHVALLDLSGPLVLDLFHDRLRVILIATPRQSGRLSTNYRELTYK